MSHCPGSAPLPGYIWGMTQRDRDAGYRELLLAPLRTGADDLPTMDDRRRPRSAAAVKETAS